MERSLPLASIVASRYSGRLAKLPRKIYRRYSGEPHPGYYGTEIFCSALAPRIEDGKMGSILVSAKLPEPKGPFQSIFDR